MNRLRSRFDLKENDDYDNMVVQSYGCL